MNARNVEYLSHNRTICEKSVDAGAPAGSPILKPFTHPEKKVWIWALRLDIARSRRCAQETGEQTDQRMSKPGSSATDMRKRALEVPAFGALAAFWHVGVLPADREFVSRFRDALLLPVDHRKTEGGAWGGRTPTGSLLIDDDETVDAVNG